MSLTNVNKVELENNKKYEIEISNLYVLNARNKLGSGAFGNIYYGTSIKNNRPVAIKLEEKDSEHPQLFYENKVYIALQGGAGISNIHWCGIQGKYNILVMDLLGPSLENWLNYCDRKFSLKTTLMLIEQMISRISYIHSKCYIHRDIKPENFLIGSGKNKNLLYLIDFGLAKQYRDPKTGKHILMKEGKNLTGTARFASLNTHLGMEQSRRDDIEQMFYVMVYLLRGRLPWQGLKAKNNKEKFDKIKEVKLKTPLNVLCAGLPHQIPKLINYSRELEFTERPDYDYIRELLKEIASKYFIGYDDDYDWVIKKRNQDEEKKRKELLLQNII